MHFEILVEGLSDRIALDILLKGILGPKCSPHTWRIYKHAGIGQFPDDPQKPPDPKNRTLLHNLPARLRAYGKSLGEAGAVIVLLDLDDRTDCRSFKKSLTALLKNCKPSPVCLFRIAVEELEAWYFGDCSAIQNAYSRVETNVLRTYVQDSQCGTWEKLADAVYPGGAKELKKIGYRKRGRTKCEWADRITPHMDVEVNRSKSFLVFRDGIRRLAGIPTP